MFDTPPLYGGLPPASALVADLLASERGRGYAVPELSRQRYPVPVGCAGGVAVCRIASKGKGKGKAPGHSSEGFAFA